MSSGYFFDNVVCGERKPSGLQKPVPITSMGVLFLGGEGQVDEELAHIHVEIGAEVVCMCGQQCSNDHTPVMSRSFLSSRYKWLH